MASREKFSFAQRIVFLRLSVLVSLLDSSDGYRKKPNKKDSHKEAEYLYPRSLANMGSILINNINSW